MDLASIFAEAIVRSQDATDSNKQAAGARCLTFVKGEEWVYSVVQGRFESEAETTKDDAISQALEDAKAAPGPARTEAEEAERQDAISRALEDARTAPGSARAEAEEAERQVVEDAIAAVETAQRLVEVAIKQSQVERKLAVLRGVMNACTDIYLEDPNTALTNRVCIDLFLQTGLPEE